MKATLLLADYARVSDGKLDVLGGGWSLINAAGAFGFALAGIVQCPWDQTNVQHAFRLELLDADGQGVPSADGETVHVEGAFEAGRPAGLKPGTPLDIPSSSRSARSSSPRPLRGAAVDQRRVAGRLVGRLHRRHVSVGLTFQ